MSKLLDNLYSYNNFGLYLIIAIVVLVILFVVILFFGKKDKKNRELEETKRLQLNSDLFKKDEPTDGNEVKEEITPVVDDKKIEVVEPVIDPMINNFGEYSSVESVVAPIEQPTQSVETPVVDVPKVSEEAQISEPIVPVINDVEPVVTNEEVSEPVLAPIEEQPLFVEEPKVSEPVEMPANEMSVPEYNFTEIANDVEKIKNEPVIELPETPEITSEPVEPEINIPEGPVTTIEEDKLAKGPEIFSSVYVPKKEEAKVEEPVIEEVKSEESDDEFEFELPTLKSSEPVEDLKKEEPATEESKPVLNSISLDSLTGESFDINKK